MLRLQLAIHYATADLRAASSGMHGLASIFRRRRDEVIASMGAYDRQLYEAWCFCAIAVEARTGATSAWSIARAS